MTRPPIIVIGMHRSGTSLVARLLSDMGVFMGDPLQGDHESVLFMRLNEALIQSAGGSWEHPAPFQQQLAQPGYADDAVNWLREQLRNRGAAHYWGQPDLPAGTPFASERPWGWKDPRNTFTLPLWGHLFPNAPVIHVKRNGFDVAQSLRVRQKKVVAAYQAQHPDSQLAPDARFTIGGTVHSLRTTDLGEAFRLWQEYLAAAEANLADWAGPGLTVAYETLVSEPRATLERLAAFCAIPLTAEQTARMAGRIERDRPMGFVDDPELRQFAIERAREGAPLFGYEEAVPG